MNKLLYLLRLLYSTGFNVVYSLLPSCLSANFSALAISTIHASYALPKVISVPCGWATDRIGKRRSLILCFISFAVLAWAFTMGQSVIWFAALFFAVGMTGNFFNPAINSLVTFFSIKKTSRFSGWKAPTSLGL